MFAVVGEGSVIATEDVSVQPFASVTVTVKVPAESPVMVAPVPELLHAYVYGDVPPEPDAVADPSEPPLQLTLVEELMLAVTAVGSVIVTDTVSSHPLASVTVTV
jgi:hypothetical protein